MVQLVAGSAWAVEPVVLEDGKFNYSLGKSLKYIEDKAGGTYAFDTWALHAGNLNITSPRLVTWIRFSSMPAHTYYLNRNYLFKDKLNEINQKFSRRIIL